MKIFFSTLLLITICFLGYAQEQKIVGDCTVTFNISSNQASTNNNLIGATKTLYIKSKLIRVDIASTAFAQSVIYNSGTGEAVILKEISGDKYLTKIDAIKWKVQNNRYDGMKLSFSGETKTILGYECKKGTATLKDGGTFTFFYAAAIIPSASENPYQFKGIPGFVLEYGIMGDDKKSEVTYSATKINFNPVPESKFEIPTTGYRVLNN